MVARGDPRCRNPRRRVYQYFKNDDRKSTDLGKPVITATQMLESMIQNPRPTRRKQVT